MKKKLIIGVAILSMAIGFVGCSLANDSYIVSVKRVHTYVSTQHTQTSDVYYAELPITSGSGKSNSKNNDILNELSDILIAPNEDIITELAQYNKVYTQPTDVKLTGEIIDNKVYFYYNGYVTTLEGETQDYNKVIECDLNSYLDILDFELDEESTFDYISALAGANADNN